jgi:hypothetical protein
MAATLLTGCGASGEALPASSVSASPSAGGSTGVAVPTCGEPETRPTWWTPSCGDAGYQLEDLVYDSWTSSRAVAHGTTLIGHGDEAGMTYRMSVTFDRPRAIAAFQDRPLFSRAVVTYLDGHGPRAAATETFDLSEVWDFAAANRTP